MSFLDRSVRTIFLGELISGLALTFRYRIDAAPQGQLTLGYGAARWDATDALGTGPAGEWREYRVRLNCLTAEPSDALETPFSLTATAPATVSLAEIRLGADTGPRICPAD